MIELNTGILLWGIIVIYGFVGAASVIVGIIKYGQKKGERKWDEGDIIVGAAMTLWIIAVLIL